MTACPDHKDIEAYCDGEDCVDSIEIERHLQQCEACAKRVADVAWLNSAVRQSGKTVRAPDSLINWLDRQDRRRTLDWPAISRRKAIAAGSLAAGLGAAGLIYSYSDGHPPMAPTLFDDFSTREAADRALDLDATSLAVVTDWFDARVPFDLPPLTSVADIGIKGARLCWLLDRRVAAIHLNEEGANGCLYLTDFAGLTLDGDHEIPSAGQPALIANGEAAGAFWRGDELAFGLIARTSTSMVGQLMQRIDGLG